MQTIRLTRSTYAEACEVAEKWRGMGYKVLVHVNASEDAPLVLHIMNGRADRPKESRMDSHKDWRSR
jgi:hypothetical protein